MRVISLECHTILSHTCSVYNIHSQYTLVLHCNVHVHFVLQLYVTYAFSYALARDSQDGFKFSV